MSHQSAQSRIEQSDQNQLASRRFSSYDDARSFPVQDSSIPPSSRAEFDAFIRVHDIEMADLKRQVRSSDAQIAGFERQARTSDEQIAGLERQVRTYDEQIAGFERQECTSARQARTSDEQIAELERQVRELTNRMSETSSFAESPNNSTTLETRNRNDSLDENDCFLCLERASTVVLFSCKQACRKCSENKSVVLCPLCSVLIESKLVIVPTCALR